MKWRRFEVGSLSRRLQREVKGGPFLQLRLRPHSSTVLVNDALHGSQSDAGAFKVFPPMQTLDSGMERKTATVARKLPRNSRIIMLVSTRPIKPSCNSVLMASLTNAD